MHVATNDVSPPYSQVPQPPYWTFLSELHFVWAIITKYLGDIPQTFWSVVEIPYENYFIKDYFQQR